MKLDSYQDKSSQQTAEQCKSAVQKGKITAEQFKEITGVDYDA